MDIFPVEIALSFFPATSNYFILIASLLTLGFPSGSAGKKSACNVGDLGSIPGLGRSLGERKGYPLQYSGLENSMDCIVHGVAKSRTRLSNFHFHFHFSLTLITIHLSLFLSRVITKVVRHSSIYFPHFQAHHVLFLSHSFPWRHCPLSLCPSSFWSSPCPRHSPPLRLPIAFILGNTINTLRSWVCYFLGLILSWFIHLGYELPAIGHLRNTLS